MPALEALDRKQLELIRKVQAAAIFVGPMTATVPTAFTTGGLKEAQTVTITGAPTGGNFILTFDGSPTAGIPWNATAAQVRAALEALPNIEPTEVAVTGGPGPATPYVVSFGGRFADVPQMTVTHTFTGGTTPAVAVTTTTTSTAIDLAALPSAYKPVGLVTKDDAYTWSRAVEMAETSSHGYVDPTRRDITQNVSSLAFSAQETNLTNLELYHNLDLGSVTADPVTGEWGFADPLQAATRYSRLIAIGRDGLGTSAIYIIRIMPRAILSEPGEQTWSDEGEQVYPMTFTATPDTALGYSMRYVFGGPGWRALLGQMGIPQVA